MNNNDKINDEEKKAIKKEMGRRLTEAMKWRGFASAREAADALEEACNEVTTRTFNVRARTVVSHAGGQNMIHPASPRKNSDASAGLYGKAFNVSWLWLCLEKDDPKPSEEELEAYAKFDGPGPISPSYFAKSAIESQKLIPFTPNDGPESNAVLGDRLSASVKFVPLYGDTVGGVEGEFIMEGNIAGQRSIHPDLSDVEGVYAALVSGDTMEPRYFDGEIVYVDPTKRPTKGDFVVAQVRQEDDGPVFAYIKRFVRRNINELVLEQINPEKEFRFPHSHVVAVHRIVLSGCI